MFSWGVLLDGEYIMTPGLFDVASFAYVEDVDHVRKVPGPWKKL